jgi:hypothetical protein
VCARAREVRLPEIARKLAAAAELDPLRLSLWMQVIRIVVKIAGKALLDGSLDREIVRERDRQRIIEELARREFGRR